MTKMLLAIVLILHLSGCGGRYILIGPKIGAVVEAVEYIESRTCKIFEFTRSQPDIVVNYSSRGCNHAFAGPGFIEIMDPECRGYETHGLGLAVHELLHELGHWHHDSVHETFWPRSVMEPEVHPSWQITEEDIEYVKGAYCTEEIYN